MTRSLTFEAISEAQPGPAWKARWDWSWPAYEAWFTARGGDTGPSRAECEAALRRHMPELVPTWKALTALTGGSDRAARFLSTWCPPAYLGGCSLAAVADAAQVRLVRNYDLSPDLNEGLLLRSEWCRPVMGMVEFLWGLSDGINDAGLSVALAYGGNGLTGEGFGITTIVRYLLETCETVPQALAALERVPSHMAYNLVLADRSGRTASVELAAGGGVTRRSRAVAANHQRAGVADRPAFTRTVERRQCLSEMVDAQPRPDSLRARFLAAPLYQTGFDVGFGTLFTAEYDPATSALTLAWPGESWSQTLDAFEDGRRTIDYDTGRSTGDASDRAAPAASPAFDALLQEALSGEIDWLTFGQRLAGGDGWAGWQTPKTPPPAHRRH